MLKPFDPLVWQTEYDLRRFQDGTINTVVRNGVVLAQRRQPHELTRRMHALVVRVFQADSLYWIVPVAPREVGGRFERKSLDHVRDPLPLATLATARLNADELAPAEALTVIGQLNTRYALHLHYGAPS